MAYRYLTVIVAITAATAHTAVFASDCSPSGCSVPSCDPCAGGAISCQSCNSGCQVCGGQGFCCDGLLGEGIDVDSLTPEAQSKQLYEALQVRLIFELPEDADVYLADQRMTTPGPKRTFIVPVNDQTKDYKYKFKIDVIRGGQKYFKKVSLDALRAGSILKIVVEAPPAPEGESATIDVVLETVAPGGEPVEKETAEVTEDAAIE